MATTTTDAKDGLLRRRRLARTLLYYAVREPPHGRCHPHHRLGRILWNGNGVKFLIFQGGGDDDDDGNDNPIAYLKQVESSWTCHLYGLFLLTTTAAGAGSWTCTANDTTTHEQLHQQQPVAYVSYRVPSLLRFAPKAAMPTTTTPVPRRVEMTLVPLSPQSQSPANTKKNNGTAATAAGTLPQKTAVSLRSVDPYVKSNGRLGLNLAGRGRGSSPKNMQLAEVVERGGGGKFYESSTNNNDGGRGRNSKANLSTSRYETASYTSTPSRKNEGVCLQMAKWNDDVSDNNTGTAGSNRPGHKTYHVDFRAPVTALHAFAFALAQLDL